MYYIQSPSLGRKRLTDDKPNALSQKRGTGMNQVIVDGYIYISIAITLTGAILSVKSFQKNKTTGFFLGCACAAAAPRRRLRNAWSW